MTDDDSDNNKTDFIVCVWLHCGHGTVRQMSLNVKY